MASEMRTLLAGDPVSAVPVLFLWPHANCNCRCLMCDIWHLRSRQEITNADLERWLDDWVGLDVRHVIFTGGEALMHSDLWSLCDVLRRRNISLTLLTTGITLERYAADVARNFERINVSLDGPRAIHDEIRRIPGAFDRMGKGVKAVKAINPILPIFARSAIHKQNAGALRALVAGAHELGLDGVSFLATDVLSEAFNRPAALEDERRQTLMLDAGDVAALSLELDALEREHRSDFASGFITESPQALRSRLLRFYLAHTGDGEFPPVTCSAPWSSAVIEYDGTVRPCFFQPAYGNIFEAGSLSAVIRSEQAAAVRATLDTTTNAVCKTCVCPIAVYRCDCGHSRKPPYCDNSCDVVDLLQALLTARVASQ